MDKIECKMIVYTKAEKRINNFDKVKKIIPQIELFEAIDCINEFDKYKKIALDNKYVSEEFIKNCERFSYGKPKYGILGCALSHIYILQDFIKNSDKNWILIFEDDLSLSNFNPKIIDYLITNAEKNNSHYVHLYTNSYFYKKQLEKEQVSPDLYKMIYQWGTVAYLIDKQGAQIVLDRMPYKNPIDHEFSENINKLNSLCFLNNVFLNKGSNGPTDKKSEMGSLLWNINK